jgi:type II secretory pathway component PulM
VNAPKDTLLKDVHEREVVLLIWVNVAVVHDLASFLAKIPAAKSLSVTDVPVSKAGWDFVV